MKIIVYNNKGGVGKTTLATHLYRWLVFEGKWCLLDMDTQGNAMSWISGNRWDGGQTIDWATESGQPTGSVATDSIDVARRFENMIVDAPPGADFLSHFLRHFTLSRRDLIVMPVGGRFSIEGAIDVIDEVRDLGSRVVVVVNVTDPEYSFSQHEIKAVTELGVELYRRAIPWNKVVREAELTGEAAWDVPFGARTLAVQLLHGFCRWIASGAPAGEETYGFTDRENRRLERFRI